jgi:hypothetical protein
MLENCLEDHPGVDEDLLRLLILFVVKIEKTFYYFVMLIVHCFEVRRIICLTFFDICLLMLELRSFYLVYTLFW